MTSYETTDAFLSRKHKEEAEHKRQHTKLEHNVEDILVLVERLIKKVDQIEKRLDNS